MPMKCPPGFNEPFCFLSSLEGARHWNDFDFGVLPVKPDFSSIEPITPWLDGVTDHEVKAFWTPRPDYGVAFIPSDEFVVLEAKGQAAGAELRRLEREHGIEPLLVCVLDETESHFFRREPGIVAGDICVADDHPHAAYIAVRTGESPVLLPPTAGWRIKIQNARRAGELSVASAKLFLSVARHNADAKIVRLHSYTLRGMSDEIRRLAVEQLHVLRDLALLGQLTFFFAAPNLGKTLILLYLLVAAILAGRIDPRLVFYVNVDDTASGLADKVQLADEVGFNMLADGHKGFRIGKLPKVLEDMISTGQSRGAVVILDTLKRFVDLMDKQKAAAFTDVARRFVLAGGTLIGLAHVNKRTRDGKPVFAGTSDMVDDADCAYTIALAPEHLQQPGERVVVFENIKRRGNVAERAVFAYSAERDINYDELLSSVRRLDVDALPLDSPLSIEVPEEGVVEVIEKCIRRGIAAKMQLRDAVAADARISKRRAVQIIERYTGEDSSRHRWKYSVQARGAKIFVLLDRPDESASTSP